MILRSATRTECVRALSLGAFLGIIFAYGFVPTARDLGHSAWMYLRGSEPFPSAGSCLGFPLLALFFALSLPAKSIESRVPPFYTHWITWLVPIGIATFYGIVFPGPGATSVEHWSELYPLIWISLCVPVGEEALFRGWIYALIQRLWPNTSPSLTNPLSLAVWGSAVAFSLWHLQNTSTQGVGLMFFQCCYSLLLGLWLGALREWSGSLWRPMLAHALINTASSLF